MNLTIRFSLDNECSIVDSVISRILRYTVNKNVEVLLLNLLRVYSITKYKNKINFRFFVKVIKNDYTTAHTTLISNII